MITGTSLKARCGGRPRCRPCGEAEVEENDPGAAVPDRVEPGHAVARMHQPEPFLLEVHPHQVGDGFLVFDQQHRPAGFHASSSTRRCSAGPVRHL